MQHWLPGQPVTDQNMGRAIFMERRYWDNMTAAITAGIQKAL
jgi:hypothetical protein